MKRWVQAGLVAAAIPVLAATTVQSASAADGKAYAAGQSASTSYWDGGDYITVCDLETDHHGAIGWIAVKQSNGSYKNFPRVYEGGGYNHCTQVVQNVLREASTIKIVSCVVDGPNGSPFNCGIKYVNES